MARLFLAACLCWVANSWTSNTHTTRHTTALRTTLRTAPQRFARGPRPLLAKYDEEDLPSFDEYSAQKLRDFLTQRSVQTVIHYFDLGRDTLRRDWLEKYGGHEVRRKEKRRLRARVASPLNMARGSRRPPILFARTADPRPPNS